MRRKIDDTKRALLTKMGGSYIGTMALDELIAARYFLSDRSDGNYIRYVIAKLGTELKRLTEAGIPEEKWPKQLRSKSWRAEIWKSFGIEEPVREEPPQSPPPPPPQVKVAVPTSPIEERFQPRLPKLEPKIDNPFKSDSFGEV